MLSIKNLHASVEGEEILKGINLEIKAGEVHAIMGPNGSGKSTLSQVLAGNETFAVTQGEISLNGENLLDLEPKSGLVKVFSWHSSIRWRFPASATCSSCAPPSTPCAHTAASRK